MAYINPAPGTTSQVVLKIEKQGTAGWTTAITVPALQDITVNAANDVFTWSQLDSTAKKQIATTSTNSLGMNIVVDDATFFGTTLNAAQSGTMAEQGLLGASRNKTFVKFSLKMVEGAADRYLSGEGYITGLAPTVSADAPVWVSPITITVSGEYAVAATE
jgi:hypothetical protein